MPKISISSYPKYDACNQNLFLHFRPNSTALNPIPIYRTPCTCEQITKSLNKTALLLSSDMNRSLLATLLLSLALTESGGVFGFSPSAVAPISTASSSHHPSHLSLKPLAFTSSSEPAPHKSSLTLLNFTPKDDNASDDKPFIRPALHNSTFFRAVSILYALLFAVYTTSKSPSATTNVLGKLGKHLILSSKAAATVHMLSFGIWFGTVFWTTFIAGITMFKNLPRRTFGTLQSKLFPLYFQLCAGVLALQVNICFVTFTISSHKLIVSLTSALYIFLHHSADLNPHCYARCS